MSTYTQSLYHIIFSTKYRNRTLRQNNKEVFYNYIFGILKSKNCFGYCIGGVEDHLHLLTSLKSDISLASLVKDIKLASSVWIKDQNIFEHFEGWQDGYAAFTYSMHEKDKIIHYIKNQETHHHKKTFKEELIDLCKEFNVKYDERYL